MLDPRDRLIFLDALRPPDGYRFDAAIGTTFSLDLMALLVAPLSFALMDRSDPGSALTNPIALLESLRRHAERIVVFCQAGRITSSVRRHLLFSYLEPMVVEVQAPEQGGVFHPKCWVLRFAPDAVVSAPVRYRCLVMSRNLTFDRSWDTVVALEGELTDRVNVIGRMNALGDFLAALPDLAVGNAVAEHVRELVKRAEQEVRRTRFTVGAPFEIDNLQFVPLGLPGYRTNPFPPDADRWLIAAPFLTPDGLAAVARSGVDNVLISRPDSLGDLSTKALTQFKQRFAVDEGAADPDLAPAADASSEDSVWELRGVGASLEESIAPIESSALEEVGLLVDENTEDLPEIPVSDEPTSLHAKLYIAESGAQATLWTGSANATSAAIPVKRHGGRNVELLVRLSGHRRDIGIDQFLASPDTGGFRQLLRPWLLVEQVKPSPEEAARKSLVDDLDHLRSALVVGGLRLEACPSGDGFDLRLYGQVALPSIEAWLTCWPIAVSDSLAQVVTGDALATGIVFRQLTGVAIARFMCFEIAGARDGVRAAIRFVLNLPLSGAPADRDALVLREIVKDKRRFLHYLLLLLAENRDPMAIGDLTDLTALPGMWRASGGVSTAVPLLEELLKALACAPEKIERVAKLVADVRRIPDGGDLLPDGFDEVWGAIEETWRGALE